MDEDALIRKIAGNRSVVADVGDDCAIFLMGEDGYELVTTDMLIEDVHFKKSWSAAADIGYKSVMVNVSDVAACGGTPVHAFLSIALPRTIDMAWVDALFSGIYKALHETGCTLHGGDTCRSSGPVIINWTMRGHVAQTKLKRRSDALPGDRVAITGSTGDALAICQWLESEQPFPDAIKGIETLKSRFHRPTAQLHTGQCLAAIPEVHALMDISDGLTTDLPRLAAQSSCGISINADAIPVSAGLKQLCQHSGQDPVSMALNGGEDYVLLLTLTPEAVEPVQERLKRQNADPLFVIGNIHPSPNKPVVTYTSDGKPFQPDPIAFKHF